MSADSPRPAAARRNGLAALVLLALLPATATAQPRGVAPAQLGGVSEPPARAFSESVKKVREQLVSPESDLDVWEAGLKKQTEAVRGVVDLGHALLLNEWGYRFNPGQPSQLKIKTGLAERFEKAVREALRGKDANRQCAAATLVADMVAVRSHPGGAPDPVMTEVITLLIPDVAESAGSGDRGVREAAARALGRFVSDPEKGVPALGKLLGDRETAVRRVAAEALVSQARGAHDRPGLVAAAACLAVVPVAAENAKDEDNEVRRSCLEAVKAAAAGLGSYIGQTMPSEPLPVAPRPGRPLPGGGANPAAPPWQVVRPATEVLGKAVRPLLPLLASDKPAAQRVQVCEALEAIAAIRARLLRAAGGTDALAAALGGKEAPLLAGLKGAVGDLADCADDKDVEVRLAALYVLEDLGPAAAPAVDKVVKGFKADDPFVRWAAARVLGKMAPAEAKTAVPALAGRVGDENADVRVTALAALVRYGPDALDAIEKVAPKVKAGDEQTRLWAVRVLAAVGTDGRKQTTAPLIEALAAKEVPVRRTAVAALVRFGKPDQATTAALRAALGDPDAEVRRTASEALLAEE